MTRTGHIIACMYFQTATTFTLMSEQKIWEIHAIAICEISNEKQLTKYVAKIMDMCSFTVYLCIILWWFLKTTNSNSNPSGEQYKKIDFHTVRPVMEILIKIHLWQKHDKRPSLDRLSKDSCLSCFVLTEKHMLTKYFHNWP